MAGYIQNVVVFCGSSTGNDTKIMAETEQLGRLLGQNGFGLIYGGGTHGLMGIVAKAALKAGAKVKGIIPEIFNKGGLGNQGELPGAEEHVVENMLIRKDQMILQADAAITLPGGFGSLDEIFEMAVTQQLKAFAEPDTPIQPLIVVNIDGYYDGQIANIDKMIEKEFLKAEFRNLIIFVDSAAEAIDVLRSLNAAPPVPAQDIARFTPPRPGT